MRNLTIIQPNRLVFGNDSRMELPEFLKSSRLNKVDIITADVLMPELESLLGLLERSGMTLTVQDPINDEPTVSKFESVMKKVRQSKPDVVIGIGGGSVLDVAKVASAMVHNNQDLQDAFGIGKLSKRRTFLICLPTTSGTGSEVSPNALFLDETDKLKKAVISPDLVPDAAYVDPMLTLNLPALVTAATAMDALTHCIEAYANRFAHPMIDLYALEGIRLIGANIKRAYDNGNDLEARTQLSLASMYGGLCLGPVNTGAVHALSYPLGSEFHIAHGISNALLLPHVMAFNIQGAPDRYAQIAFALGVKPLGSKVESARAGTIAVKDLLKGCGLPQTLTDLGIAKMDIQAIAKSAMTVTRLLNNNVREVRFEDAIKIYEGAL
jgi:alcohol dehydrogenase class IV